ncbi:MAG TPA: TetR/AcrR family transcriptional regulator [Rhodospirillaceae bacterium]|nr:TetR/AcrR family transcriptional regulator [Rhodospirillaceae bacterium]
MATAPQPTVTGARLASRTRRGEERCQRIRAVAAELFLAQGYEGVSLDDVIIRAGGSKTNIYNHFGGKEGLFLTMVEGLLDEVTAPLRKLDLAGLSFEEGLRSFVHTLLNALLRERHLALYRLVIGESARIPGLAQRWSSHGPDVTQSVLVDFLSRQAADGRRGYRRAAACSWARPPAPSCSVASPLSWHWCFCRTSLPPAPPMPTGHPSRPGRRVRNRGGQDKASQGREK